MIKKTDFVERSKRQILQEVFTIVVSVALIVAQKAFILNEWMNEWMSEWVSEWMNEWMNEWMYWMNEWMNEWTNEWMNEWMNERMNEWMNEWIMALKLQLYVCKVVIAISWHQNVVWNS